MANSQNFTQLLTLQGPLEGGKVLLTKKNSERITGSEGIIFALKLITRDIELIEFSF